jgi:serine protease Do
LNFILKYHPQHLRQWHIALLLLAVMACNVYAQPKMPASAATAAAPAASPIPQPSASARELFSRYNDRVVQVRVLRDSANEQSSLGSAFVVRADADGSAWLTTNYHVVSSLAIHPDKFRLELRLPNDRAVKAKLVAIDVIHDLAVLQSVPDSATTWPALALRDKPLTQGEKIFSMGNPLEVGFLISEGIYNGLAESRIYDQMIFSGALNSGMSGGPAIDESGRVVGVNVSTLRRGVLISFLVPVKYAQILLARAWQVAPAAMPKEWRSEIAKQLLAHQDFVAGKFFEVSKLSAEANKIKLGYASQTLSGRNVQTLDGTLTRCWAGGRDGEKVRYQRDTLSCSLQSGLYVDRDLFTGMLAIEHTLLRNDKLATAQFLALNQRGQFATNYSRRDGAEHTPSQCRNDYVNGKKQIYRVEICVTALKKYAGLYDYNVLATQIDSVSERLSSRLTMNGFSFENAQQLSKLFLARLQ